MTELFTDTVLNMMTTTAEPEDYTGEDGLLYCGKCRTAKEAYFPKETAAWLGHDKHPTECDCQREKRLECESAEERRRHRYRIGYVEVRAKLPASGNVHGNEFPTERCPLHRDQ